MLKSLFTFNFKQWPGALLCALALLFITEVIARQFSIYIMAFSDEVILYKNKILESSSQKIFDGIIIGDSVLLGIDAGFLSKQLSKECRCDYSIYNFSLPAHGVEGYYLLLKKYLKKHPAPKIILFAPEPMNWTLKANFVHKNQAISPELHRFCLLFSLKEGLDVFPFKFWSRFLIAEIERKSFLVAYRRMIRDFLENRLGTYQPEPTVAHVSVGMNGGVRFGIGIPPQEKVLRLMEQDNAIFIPDEGVLFWYKKFFNLAAEHQIRVVILPSALIDTVFTQWQQNGNLERYVNMMTALQKEYPNLLVLNPLVQSFDRTLFLDPIHLNGKGFQLYTQQLSHQLLPLVPELLTTVQPID